MISDFVNNRFKFSKKLIWIFLIMIISANFTNNTFSQNKVYARDINEENDDFVYISDYVNDAILDIRYFSNYNFVGEKIDGYLAPRPMLTKPAAIALVKAAEDLRAQGYRIIVYDAYRPKKAVKHFIRWVEDDKSKGLKEDFFPKYDKKMLFKLGFISKKSGHSRGSTIDLGLVTKDSKLVDMGGNFDYFDDVSNADYENISNEQKSNRKILKDAMLKAGFRGIKSEWWHFTLKNEPYPYTYFDFDVK